MSLLSTPFAGPFTTQLIKQTSANATPNEDVRGGATDVVMIQIDNSANPSQSVYLHMYDNAAPVVGTTPPDTTIKVLQGIVLELIFLPNLQFGTALSFACTTLGGLGGSASPTNPVIVDIACS